ncbi:hypothetical protein GA0115254_128196 [Streptomyces sp. Ncost-T10-10d]|nr:hypothetical protein GA0115254_128196 [Streptomyces sp. Ncost-T10-10d]
MGAGVCSASVGASGRWSTVHPVAVAVPAASGLLINAFAFGMSVFATDSCSAGGAVYAASPGGPWLVGRS